MRRWKTGIMARLEPKNPSRTGSSRGPAGSEGV